MRYTEAHIETLRLIRMLESIRHRDNITLLQCVRRYNFVSRTS